MKITIARAMALHAGMAIVAALVVRALIG